MIAVTDKRGQQGRLLNESEVTTGRILSIELEDGRRLRVPASWLQPEACGTYRVDADFNAMREQPSDEQNEDRFTIPLIEETLEVQTQQSHNTVRLRKVAREHEEVLRQPMLREEVEIERVPVNQPVTGPVAARQEGDTLVIPLVEEEIVWERRLVIREEIRVRKRRTEQEFSERVPLRREELLVDREDQGTQTDKR